MTQGAEECPLDLFRGGNRDILTCYERVQKGEVGGILKECYGVFILKPIFIILIISIVFIYLNLLFYIYSNFLF